MIGQLALAAILLAILLTALLLWYVVAVARKRARALPSGAAEISQRRNLAQLRWSFGSAVAHIEANLASRWRRYRIPWILLLGEAGAGKSTLLECAGVDRAGSVAAGAVQHVGVGWNYFNRGVVLDVAGEYLRGGAGSGDQAWQSLLYLAEKYRPRRPIDGVVVTLSAADLLAAARAGAEELVQRGELMHRRLWQAQSRFGIRFPVYVVITQCDRLTGFSSFARALPAHLRDGMLGWSNPYDVQAGYRSEWVEQSVDAIVRDVFEAQSELLAAGRTIDDPDAFVLFPAALLRTRDALRTYLDELFRPSAYHETFFFRGVYLSGDASAAAQAESRLAVARAATPAPDWQARSPLEPPPPELAPRRDAVFAKDLLERKVFGEFGLARASREALVTRNRTARILRWCAGAIAAVWTGALVIATNQLDRMVTSYNQAVDVVGAATKERSAIHARKEHLPVDWYLRNTRLLLDKMAPIGGQHLWWVALPRSWAVFDTTNQDIQSVLFRGFQDIVFNAVRKGLNVKVAELTGIRRHEITTEFLGDPAECGAARAGERDRATPATLAIEELPEFARLREQVQRLELLEANLATYARLLRKDEGEMRELRALLRYTWGIELPESLDQPGYHTLAMRQQFTFKERNPAEVLPKAAACAFRRDLERLYARFFAGNQALLSAEDLAARIGALTERAEGAVRETEPYAELVERINALDALLKSPRARWLAAGERDLGAAFDDLLQHVAGAPDLGSRIADAARARAQAEIDNVRRNLLQTSAEAVGPIVRRSAEGAWAVAPEVAALQSALAVLLKQRFMAHAEGRRLDVRIDPGTVVRWDAKRLDEAIALADEQRRFLKDNLAKFPALLQVEIHSIADSHLAGRMTDLVAKAEAIVPDLGRRRDVTPAAEATAETHDFERAGPQLVRLLGLFKDLGADATYEDLSSLLKRDALRGLLAVNRALDGSELYTVRDGDFSWWQGTKNPGPAAFRAADPQALADVLGQQYGQVEWLSKLGAPLLALVDSAGIRLDAQAARVVRRMRGIAREVERFKNKNPKNSIAELEAFIRTDMAEIDGSNCVEKLAPKLGTAREADFFLERQVALRQLLYARCVEIVTADASRAYAMIEQGFTRALAGRFPFGQQAERGGGEADPEDVVQFLRLYDRYVKAVQPALSGKIAPTAATANVGRFLEQLDRVRAFLAPLVPPEDGAPAAGYEIGVEFRVNQKAEIDGNRIVDWTLEVGDQAVRLRDASRQVRWRPGMPITLTLRWAKDASNAPVNDGAIAHLSVDGKNVAYRFGDPWALVTMLRMHAASPVDGVTRSDIRPHTLKFEFVTQPIPEAGQYRSNQPESRAKVFLRLSLAPGGKKDLLTLPVFPSQAPAFRSEVGERQQRQVARPAVASDRPGLRAGWPDAYGGFQAPPAPAAKPRPVRASRGTGD